MGPRGLGPGIELRQARASRRLDIELRQYELLEREERIIGSHKDEGLISTVSGWGTFVVAR